MPSDPVNHPPHYTSHPSGIEAIDICEHFNFNLGNAFKYIFRADLKGSPIEDLEKAKWYLEREIKNRRKMPQEDKRGSTCCCVCGSDQKTLHKSNSGNWICGFCDA